MSLSVFPANRSRASRACSQASTRSPFENKEEGFPRRRRLFPFHFLLELTIAHAVTAVEPLGLGLRCRDFHDFPRLGPRNVPSPEGLLQPRQLFETLRHVQQRARLSILEAETFAGVVDGRGKAVPEIKPSGLDFLKIEAQDGLHAAMHAGRGDEAPIDLARGEDLSSFRERLQQTGT